jgi:hypothetical protein
MTHQHVLPHEQRLTCLVNIWLKHADVTYKSLSMMYWLDQNQSRQSFVEGIKVRGKHIIMKISGLKLQVNKS